MNSNNPENIDLSEVAKFNAIASDWWNPAGAFKTLHDINPLRLAFMRESLDFTGKKVLDVGCGGGILSESMAKLGAAVTAIDLSENVIQVAQQHAQQENLTIDYKIITVEELAEKKPESFDIITCMELLEHVPDPTSIITACSKLAKPNASLFFSTLNRNLKAYLFAVIGAEYFLKLLPKGTHDYNKFIRPSEFANWARAAGLEVKKLKGLSYHPLQKEYKITDNIDVNYLIYTTKSPI